MEPLPSTLSHAGCVFVTCLRFTLSRVWFPSANECNARHLETLCGLRMLLRQSLIPRLTSGSLPLYPAHTTFDFSYPLSYEHVFYQRSFRHTWKYISKYMLLSFQHALPYLPPIISPTHLPSSHPSPTNHCHPPIPRPHSWNDALVCISVCCAKLALLALRVKSVLERTKQGPWAHAVTVPHQTVEMNPGLRLLSVSSFLYLSCLSSERGKKADPQGSADFLHRGPHTVCLPQPGLVVCFFLCSPLVLWSFLFHFP